MMSLIILNLLVLVYEISSSRTQEFNGSIEHVALNHSKQSGFPLTPSLQPESQPSWASSDAPVTVHATEVTNDQTTMLHLPDNQKKLNHFQSGEKINRTKVNFLCKDHVNQTQHTGSDFLFEVPNKENETNASCPCLKDIIDLVGKVKSWKNTTELEHKWPCEVRIFWLKMHWLATLVRFLFHYVMIVIVTFGVLFNALSFCVLSISPMNTCSVSVYLRALAVADTGVLLHNGALVLRFHLVGLNEYFVDNPWSCFLDRILYVMSHDYSTWLVVALTLERLIMVIFPFSIHNWGNTRVATRVVIILAGVGLVIAVLRLPVQGFERDDVFGFTACGSKSEYWSGYLYLFISFGSWIPTTLIFFCNIYLMIQIHLSVNRRSSLSAFRFKGDVKTFRMTRMLLLVSVSYLFTALPLAIAAGTEIYWRAGLGVQPNEEDIMAYINGRKQLLLLKWIRCLLFFFYIMNFGCNFFLYYISGQKFRRAVKDFLCRKIPSLCIKNIKKPKQVLNTNNNHRVLGSTSSNLSLVTNRHMSISSTISEFVYHNSAFTNTKKEIQ